MKAHTISLMPKKALVMSFVFVGIVTGCAPSYSDMRSQTAIEQQDFEVPAGRLADCAQNALTLKYGSGRGLLDNTYSFSRLVDGETIHLLAQIGEIPMWDLTFVTSGASSTRVEVRATRNIAGDPNYPSDMWDSLKEACH